MPRNAVERARSPDYDASSVQAPLAQLAEQRTLNPQVGGSTPPGRTKAQLSVHLDFGRDVAEGAFSLRGIYKTIG